MKTHQIGVDRAENRPCKDGGFGAKNHLNVFDWLREEAFAPLDGFEDRGVRFVHVEAAVRYVTDEQGFHVFRQPFDMKDYEEVRLDYSDLGRG